MAVDLFSEASPRYSFSHDINPSSLIPARSDTITLDTAFDFEFGISETHLGQDQSSSADELFSQGILLPIQICEKAAPTSNQPIHPNPETNEITSKANEEEAKELAAEKPHSKPSFWSFKRSSSLSCVGECKKSLLCSLQGLSRSNSTGSVPNNPKKTMQSKDKASTTASNSNFTKHPPLPKSSSTSSSSSSFYQLYNQKPLNSKGLYYGGSSSYGPGGYRPSSVLNVPNPYISNTNLFGLGSLFRNGKDKKPKK